MQKIELQSVFLDFIIRERIATTVFLMNGVKLQGVIEGFDQESILLEHKGHRQLVFRHAISTIMPSVSVLSYTELVKQERQLA